MRISTSLVSLVCFVLFCSMPALAQTNLSVQELKEQYNLYDKMANDPDVFWIITTDMREFEHALYSTGAWDLAGGRFVSRAVFEKIMKEKVMKWEEKSLEERVALVTRHINNSQAVKANMRNNLLPNLEEIIKRRENSANPNTNLNDNTYHQPKTSSFDNVLEDMTSDEHLESLNFDNILAQNDGSTGGTSIQDSQTDSFDGNWNSDWNNAGNNNYSDCPKKQPDNRSSFKIYPNGQASGNTYRLCAYFGNGYLSREATYVNGKRDGLETTYLWSKKFNFPYVSKRDNYSNGKRDGLLEYYSLTRNGAVYRSSMTTYSGGIQHGDGSQWYENGQTAKDNKFLNGKIVLQYNYRKDGSFSYCTEWRADRKPRDCKTGKLH